MPSAALESGEQFQQIADHLPVVVALATADLSKFLFVNRAYERVWGRSVASLYGDSLSFLEGIHPDDQARCKAALANLVLGIPIESIECRVIRPDGSSCWVLCRGFPVRDSLGKIVRLVGSAEDITQQKTAEEKLRLAYSQAQTMLRSIRESEDRYRDLVEHSTDLPTAVRQASRNKRFITKKLANLATCRVPSAGNANDRETTPAVKPTYRESEVIRLLSAGLANKQIAGTLGISVRTAEMHRANIMKKLGLRSLAELVRYAIDAGLTPANTLAPSGARTSGR